LNSLLSQVRPSEFINKKTAEFIARITSDDDYGTGVHRGEDLYEVGGFIVHFFSEEKVKHLAKGFNMVEINEFEEGGLPRKLFQVTLKKIDNN
jgi:hypothetical protein